MAKIKSVDDCRCPQDFEKLAYKMERLSKCEVKNGGNHVIVKVPGKGAMPIKRSERNGQISGYLLSAMRKQWLSLGLTVFILCVIGRILK